jgi:hypothetical protein
LAPPLFSKHYGSRAGQNYSCLVKSEHGVLLTRAAMMKIDRLLFYTWVSSRGFVRMTGMACAFTRNRRKAIVLRAAVFN